MNLLEVLGPSEIILILLISLLSLALPIAAIVDIVKSKFEGNTKLIWIIVIVFFNIIGSILYFIFGRNQKLQQ